MANIRRRCKKRTIYGRSGKPSKQIEGKTSDEYTKGIIIGRKYSRFGIPLGCVWSLEVVNWHGGLFCPANWASKLIAAGSVKMGGLSHNLSV